MRAVRINPFKSGTTFLRGDNGYDENFNYKYIQNPNVDDWPDSEVAVPMKLYSQKVEDLQPGDDLLYDVWTKPLPMMEREDDPCYWAFLYHKECRPDNWWQLSKEEQDDLVKKTAEKYARKLDGMWPAAWTDTIRELIGGDKHEVYVRTSVAVTSKFFNFLFPADSNGLSGKDFSELNDHQTWNIDPDGTDHNKTMSYDLAGCDNIFTMYLNEDYSYLYQNLFPYLSDEAVELIKHATKPDVYIKTFIKMYLDIYDTKFKGQFLNQSQEIKDFMDNAKNDYMDPDTGEVFDGTDWGSMYRYYLTAMRRFSPLWFAENMYDITYYMDKSQIYGYTENPGVYSMHFDDIFRKLNYGACQMITNWYTAITEVKLVPTHPDFRKYDGHMENGHIKQLPQIPTHSIWRFARYYSMMMIAFVMEETKKLMIPTFGLLMNLFFKLGTWDFGEDRFNIDRNEKKD